MGEELSNVGAGVVSPCVATLRTSRPWTMFLRIALLMGSAYCAGWSIATIEEAHRLVSSSNSIDSNRSTRDSSRATNSVMQSPADLLAPHPAMSSEFASTGGNLALAEDVDVVSAPLEDDEPGVAGFLTRVLVDEERQLVHLTREPFFSMAGKEHEVRSALWKSCKEALAAGASTVCIPDVIAEGDIEHFDHRWMVAGSEVRFALRLWGPPEGESAAGNTAVECVLWVDGIFRAIGHLSNTLPEVEKQPVFHTISVYIAGRVLVTTACLRSAGEWRLSMMNGNLGSSAAWTIDPSELFDAQEVEHSPNDDDAEAAQQDGAGDAEPIANPEA